MNLKDFIKDKNLLTILLLFAIATIEIFLIPYNFKCFRRKIFNYRDNKRT